MKTTTKVYVDASPNRACYVIGDHTTQYHITRFQAPVNNTIAELKAVVIALGNIQGDLNIFTDSQSIVKILSNHLQIPSPKYHTLLMQYHKLISHRRVHIIWIKRNKNIAGKLLDRG